MIAKFEQEFYNKNFSHEDQDKCNDGCQEELNFGWFMLLMREGQYQKKFPIMIITMME